MRELTRDERVRVPGSSRSEIGIDDISDDVLELLGMVISACVLVVLSEDVLTQADGFMLLPGGSEPAVQWVRRCRKGSEPLSRELMRSTVDLELLRAYGFAR